MDSQSIKERAAYYAKRRFDRTLFRDRWKQSSMVQTSVIEVSRVIGSKAFACLSSPKVQNAPTEVAAFNAFWIQLAKTHPQLFRASSKVHLLECGLSLAVLYAQQTNPSLITTYEEYHEALERNIESNDYFVHNKSLDDYQTEFALSNEFASQYLDASFDKDKILVPTPGLNPLNERISKANFAGMFLYHPDDVCIVDKEWIDVWCDPSKPQYNVARANSLNVHELLHSVQFQKAGTDWFDKLPDCSLFHAVMEGCTELLTLYTISFENHELVDKMHESGMFPINIEHKAYTYKAQVNALLELGKHKTPRQMIQHVYELGTEIIVSDPARIAELLNAFAKQNKSAAEWTEFLKDPRLQTRDEIEEWKTKPFVERRLWNKARQKARLHQAKQRVNCA